MTDKHRKRVRQTNRETCYFCISEGPIETHHIIPRRYDGSDHESNLVDLCPTCHRKLERLYNKDFYKRVGAEGVDDRMQVVIGTVAEQLRDKSDELTELARGIETDYVDAQLTVAFHNAAEQFSEKEPSPNGPKSPLEHKEDRNLKLEVREIIAGVEREYEDGAPIDVVLNKAAQDGIDADTTRDQIEKLRTTGEAYEPKTNHLRTT